VDTQKLSQLFGPSSQLSVDENQLVVNRFDRNRTYLLGIDAAGSVVNCSFNTQRWVLTPQQWARTLFGDEQTSTADGSSPCSVDSARWGACDAWRTTLRGHCADAHAPVVQIHGWTTLNRSSDDKSTAAVGAHTNSILLPAACKLGPSMFAHTDYTDSWAANPGGGVFSVPPDSQCTQVDGMHMRRLTHPSLVLAAGGQTLMFGTTRFGMQDGALSLGR
jgi:hypothetical protein